MGSWKVPGNPNRGWGKGWASPGDPCLGLGMGCDRISETGIVTGCLLPSRLSLRLIPKRERRQRAASGPGLRAWPLWPGLAVWGRASDQSLEGSDLPLYRQICLPVSSHAQLHLAQGAHVPAQVLGGGARLRCFDLLASEVRRFIVGMWLRKCHWPTALGPSFQTNGVTLKVTASLEP